MVAVCALSILGTQSCPVPVVDITLANTTVGDANYSATFNAKYQQWFYQQIPEVHNTVLTVMMIVFFVMGIPGNLLVVAVHRKNYHQKASTFFMTNLAIIDIFSCLSVIPFTIVVTYVLIPNDWVCKLFGWFEYTTVGMSTYTLIMIAFDRYFALCRPLDFVVTMKRARIMTIMSGLFAMIQAVPLGLLVGGKFEVHVDSKTKLLVNTGDCRFGYDFNYFHENMGRVLRLLVFIQYMSFVLIISVLYSITFRKMYAHQAKRKTMRKNVVMPTTSKPNDVGVKMFAEKTKQETSNGENGIKTTKLQIQKSGTFQRLSSETNSQTPPRASNLHMAKVLLLITLVFTLSWLPFFLVRFEAIPYQREVFFLFLINNWVNPFIYLLTRKQFRHDAKVMFKKTCNCYRRL